MGISLEGPVDAGRLGAGRNPLRAHMQRWCRLHRLVKIGGLLRQSHRKTSIDLGGSQESTM